MWGAIKIKTKFETESENGEIPLTLTLSHRERAGVRGVFSLLLNEIHGEGN
jgi:hypothetical protein